jgi:phosphatidylserine decarboxylase
MKKLIIALSSVGILSLFGWKYFHRHPKRNIPNIPNAIVSPADGKIIHIEVSNTKQFSFFKKDIQNKLEISGIDTPFHIVVIELNILNVHVQKAPIEGNIASQKYYEGKFQNAVYNSEKSHLSRENEKMVTVIDNGKIAVGVIQVAGTMARRIESYVEVGENVTKGQDIGIIKLGSQVVLILPKDKTTLSCKVGDILTDGETIVAYIK